MAKYPDAPLLTAAEIEALSNLYSEEQLADPLSVWLSSTELDLVKKMLDDEGLL